MTYYKTLSERLTRAGWTITDESHEADEFVCDSNKDGKPGKILKLWQGGKPCRV